MPSPHQNATPAGVVGPQTASVRYQSRTDSCDFAIESDQEGCHAASHFRVPRRQSGGSDASFTDEYLAHFARQGVWSRPKKRYGSSH